MNYISYNKCLPDMFMLVKSLYSLCLNLIFYLYYI